MHQHPIYKKYRPRWEEYRLAYEGGDEYLDQFLFRHEKERQADFMRRRERAFYPNHVKAVIDTYAAHLYREPIPRSSDSEILQAFWQDIDLLDSTADDLWESAAQLVQRDGRCAIVVDRFDPDGGEAATRAQELEAGRRPYAYTVESEDIVDWDVDRVGRFHWVVIREVADVERGWLDEHPGTTYQYRVWTPSEWILYRPQGDDEDGGETKFVEVDRAEHPVGRVPVVFAFWGRRGGVEPVSESAIKDLAPMNRRLTNLYSLIDEQIYQHVFNILAAPQSTYDSLKSTEWGASGVVPYADDVANPPHYIGPDVSQIEAIHKQIEKTEGTIRQLSGLGRVNEETAHVQTGIALSYLTMDKDALLAQFAQQMERKEAEVDDLALRWMDDSSEVEREYPQSFDPREVEDELEAALQFEGLNPGGQAHVENVVEAVKARLGSRVSAERLEEIISDVRQRLTT